MVVGCCGGGGCMEGRVICIEGKVLDKLIKLYYGEGGEEEKPPEQKYKYLYILSVLDIYRQEHGRPPRHRWGWGRF